MEIAFIHLDKLQLLINVEKSKYKHAIQNNQPHEIVKSICYKISKLQAEVLLLMEEINERYIKVCTFKN